MDHELEPRRTELINRVTQAFADNGLALEKFEVFVTQLQAAGNGAELETLAASLPQPRQNPFREIICNRGSLRMTGPWLTSLAWHIEGVSSNIRLDLRDYEDVQDLELVLDLDLISCNCRLILPFGWNFEGQFTSQVSSNVKNKVPRAFMGGSNTVIVTGSLVSCNFKVKYR